MPSHGPHATLTSAVVLAVIANSAALSCHILPWSPIALNCPDQQRFGARQISRLARDFSKQYTKIESKLQVIVNGPFMPVLLRRDVFLRCLNARQLTGPTDFSSALRWYSVRRQVERPKWSRK
jgi:hypothetical protein